MTNLPESIWAYEGDQHVEYVRATKLTEIDTHRRKVIAENERLLTATIESNRRIAGLEARIKASEEGRARAESEMAMSAIALRDAEARVKELEEGALLLLSEIDAPNGIDWILSASQQLRTALTGGSNG